MNAESKSRERGAVRLCQGCRCSEPPQTGRLRCQTPAQQGRHLTRSKGAACPARRELIGVAATPVCHKQVDHSDAANREGWSAQRHLTFPIAHTWLRGFELDDRLPSLGRRAAGRRGLGEKPPAACPPRPLNHKPTMTLKFHLTQVIKLSNGGGPSQGSHGCNRSEPFGCLQTLARKQQTLKARY